MGLNRVFMGLNPSFSPLPLASAHASQIAASATVLALHSRQMTGIGDQIEVPLAAAVMEGLCYNSIKVENMPERYLIQRELEIERRRLEGLPMNLNYEDLQELLDPFFRSYMCKDGLLSANAPKQAVHDIGSETIILSGRCSAMTNAQVAACIETGAPCYQLDPLKLTHLGRKRCSIGWLSKI